MKAYAEKVWENETKTVPVGDGAVSLQGKSDSEWWNLFKNGDEEAFNLIYIQYFPILYQYGCQFSGDKELVKDAIQDLFIYLREKRKNIGETTSIKFYLYKSFRRRLMHYLKKSKFWETLDFNRNLGFEIALSQEARMISNHVSEAQQQNLEKAFETLTKRQKEIIIYYFYEGFSYKEITSLMGFSKTQYARILVSRSIQKLRKEISNAGFALIVILITLVFRS